MHINNDISKLFNISIFINNGCFDIDDSNINHLDKLSDDKFGENPIMLYFKNVGYNITMQLFETVPKIRNQQIEITNPAKIEEKTLKSLLGYSNIKSGLINDIIEDIYEDDDEKVIFLKTGPMLYYNRMNENFLLSKIIQDHQPSKNLVKKLLIKLNSA